MTKKVKSFSPELVEELEDGTKKIKGTLLVHNYRSGNNWYYSKDFNKKIAETMQEKIENGESLTIRSIHHPQDHVLQTVGKLTKVWEELGFETESGETIDCIRYEGNVFPTTSGKDISILLENDVIQNTSIRASNPIARPEVIEGEETRYLLDADPKGVDFTDNPGIKYANVNLVEENSKEEVVSLELTNEELNKNYKGGQSKMTLEELRKEHPDLYNRVRSNVEEEIKTEFKVGELTEEKDNLKEKKEKLEESLEATKGEKKELEESLKEVKGEKKELEEEKDKLEDKVVLLEEKIGEFEKKEIKSIAKEIIEEKVSDTDYTDRVKKEVLKPHLNNVNLELEEEVEDVKEEIESRIDKLFEEKTNEIDVIMTNSKNPLTNDKGEIKEELKNKEDEKELEEEDKEMEEIDSYLNNK